MKHCPRAVSIARPSTLQPTALPSELAAALASLRPNVIKQHKTESFSRCSVHFLLSDEAGNNHCEMHLLPLPLFSIPTDNVHMMNTRVSDNSRIFMAGKDGCLHELFYQVSARSFAPF